MDMNSSTSGVPNFMHSSMLDSKSTVAEILSSMTVAGPLTPTVSCFKLIKIALINIIQICNFCGFRENEVITTA